MGKPVKFRSLFLLLLFLVSLRSLGGTAWAQTLTLSEAVEIALQNSPMAITATERVAEASARTRQVQALFYPSLRVSSAYARSDNPAQVFAYALSQGEFSLSSDLNNPGTADNWLLSGQAGLRVFSGGRDWANRRAAKAEERGMRNLEQSALDELTLAVIRSFLGLLTASENVRSAEASLRAYESSEQVVGNRVAAGTSLKTELLNIQVEKARAEERLLAARNGLALAREGLGLVMGLDSMIYTDFASLDSINVLAPETDITGERPEVLAQAAFADAAQAQLRAAQSGFLPAVDFFATIDRNQGWTYDGSKNSWSAGLLLQWSLFDGFSTAAKVSETRARLKAAREQSRQTRLQASVERSAATFNAREAEERVGVMERAVALARESADLTRQRFAQGLAISSQVIDAEDALIEAEFGLARAKADRLLALATLRRALALPIIGDTQS